MTNKARIGAGWSRPRLARVENSASWEHPMAVSFFGAVRRGEARHGQARAKNLAPRISILGSKFLWYGSARLGKAGQGLRT